MYKYDLMTALLKLTILSIFLAIISGAFGFGYALVRNYQDETKLIQVLEKLVEIEHKREQTK